MNKVLKLGGAAVLLLAATAVAVVLLGEQRGKARAERKVTVNVQAVAYTDDAAAVQRGSYLYASRGCGDCHGANGGGATLANDGKGTHLAGPNLTRGNPAMAAYTEVDWVRSIRHGVAPDGHALRLMASEDYNRLSNADLAALVAHLRQLPPVSGREKPVLELPLPARVLYGFGQIPEAYEKIDHRLPPLATVAEAATPEYGEYVAQMCKGCHGGGFDGGKIVGAPPDWPPAPRLSAGADSAMARYGDLAAFARMMSSGKRPDGTPVAVMPFGALAQMNATEVEALYRYLRRQAGL